MGYLMRNVIFGHTVIAPSKAAMENILKHSKESLDRGKKAYVKHWEFVKEVDDGAAPARGSELSIDELEALLAEKRGEQTVERKKPGRKPKEDKVDETIEA